MRLSGVMPIHNEEKYLPYSLRTLAEVPLDELVIVLDRCSDKSQEIARKFASRTSFDVRIILKNEAKVYATADVFCLGFEEARGEVVYSLAADCLYDRRIFYLDWRGMDVASFAYVDYPLYGAIQEKIQSLWINFFKELNKQKLSGIYAFRKSVFDSIPKEDIYGNKRFGEDVRFLRAVLNKNFRYRYFSNYRNVHLRPATGIFAWKHEMQGTTRAKLKYPLWRVLGHSILFCKPKVLKAYLRDKT